MPEMALAGRTANRQQIASQQHARREQVRNRHARESRLQTLGAATAGVVLAGALAGGLYFGVISPMLKPVAVEKMDPFAQSRTADIYVPIEGGNFCRLLQFNNVTGEMNNKGLVNCAESIPNGADLQAPRNGGYSSFRESFQKR
jgi:hypothetical protein